MNVSHAHAGHVFAPIKALDLSTVRTRLMHPRAGLGWSEARTLEAENDYRAFLLCAKVYPAESPSPTADVDCFWHYHILDTVKYARDCDTAFGYFLHHKPDVALPAESEQAIAARGAAYCTRTDLRAAQSMTAGQDAYCTLTRPVSWHAAPARGVLAG